MKVLRVGCLGVVVEILASESSVPAERALEWLARDFARFAPPDSSEPILIRLTLASARPLPFWRGLPLLRANGATAYGWREHRICDYGEQGWVASRREDGLRLGVRLIDVHADDASDLIELGYLALLSSLGEELDSQGVHRLHALGFGWQGRASLVTLDSGGGKSSLAWLLSELPGAAIYSDESPLLESSTGQVRMHPFPVRMALRPEVAQRLGIPKGEGKATDDRRVFRRRRHGEKLLIDLPADRTAREPRAVGRIFIGRPGFAQPAVRKAGSAEVARALAGPLVAGLGLAQMAEHLLRPAAAPRLARIAASRARLALKLARQAEGYRFELGPDPAANLQALLQASSSS